MRKDYAKLVGISAAVALAFVASPALARHHHHHRHHHHGHHGNMTTTQKCADGDSSCKDSGGTKM